MATIKEIRQRLELAPEFALNGSGLKWKTGHRAGKQAGCGRGGRTKDYWRLQLNGKGYYCHQIVALLAGIEGHRLPRRQPGEYVIDHSNGNTSDNRPENLRVLSQRENRLNSKRHRDGALPGCYFNAKDKKWFSQLRVDGVLRHLGSFDTEQEAHQRYVEELGALGIYVRRDLLSAA